MALEAERFPGAAGNPETSVSFLSPMSFHQEGKIFDPNNELFDPNKELSYADRVRRREPGDDTLGLSPHCDAGSIERWTDSYYQKIYKDYFSDTTN